MSTSAAPLGNVSSTVPQTIRSAWTSASDEASFVVAPRWTIGAEDRRPRIRTALDAPSGQTRIELCGRLTVQIHGESLQARLPGRQGRMLLAYLAAHRARPVARDELMGALWPSTAPIAPGPALSTLLTRLRHALGKGVVEGRHELSLRLAPGSWVDLEVMEARAARAERALARNKLREAMEAGHEALALTERRLLPEFAEPWVEELRTEIDERRFATLEVCARAGLTLGGHDLGAAERAARALVTQNPFRESGYALLMDIHAARGDVAEALRAYNTLRVILRDDLGVLPSPALVKLNDQLLGVE